MTSNHDWSEQDLSSQDLSNKNFSHHNLTRTNLNGSDLSNCCLNGANLQDAHIHGANLTYATLCGAKLPNAKLNGADLRWADLTGADLGEADLRRCNFRDAKLRNTNLSGAKVQGALFQSCEGLTEDLKHDLKNRGAIFKDTTSRVHDIRWWVQFVIVPLAVASIGGGGVMGLLNNVNAKANCSPSQSVPSANCTQPTPSPKTIPNNKAMTPSSKIN